MRRTKYGAAHFLCPPVGRTALLPPTRARSLPSQNRRTSRRSPPSLRAEGVAISTAAVGCADRHINIENPGYTMLIGAIDVNTWCRRLPEGELPDGQERPPWGAPYGLAMTEVVVTWSHFAEVRWFRHVAQYPLSQQADSSPMLRTGEPLAHLFAGVRRLAMASTAERS